MIKNNKSDSYLAIGLMSGTSLDGIDAAVLKCNGNNIYEFLGGGFFSFENNLKADLKQLISGNYKDKEKIEKEFTYQNFNAIEKTKEKLGLSHIDVIGFHGQTIKHEPHNRFTEQIGDGALLAKLTNTKVVYDFRTNDVTSGGQGAPFVPIFLQTVAGAKNLNESIFLNIGGICNICYCKDENLIAFDIGPGNAPINDLTEGNLNLPFDDKGKIAASGTPNFQLIDEFLKHEFFKASPPKSLDRNQFNYSFLKELPLNDALATLTFIIAHSLKLSLKFLPTIPKEIIVSGGGVHNTFLIKTIEKACNLKVIPFESLNIESDLVEAYAFGFLAVRSLLKLPISFPLTTGVPQPCIGGVIANPYQLQNYAAST